MLYCIHVCPRALQPNSFYIESSSLSEQKLFYRIHTLVMLKEEEEEEEEKQKLVVYHLKEGFCSQKRKFFFF